jgi:hypothetical protein
MGISLRGGIYMLQRYNLRAMRVCKKTQVLQTFFRVTDVKCLKP